MNENIFNFLKYAIPICYISVSNTTTETAYNFDININDYDYFVTIYISYSHTTQDNVYIKYSLYLDDNLIETVYKPVLKKTGQKLSTLKKKLSTPTKNPAKLIILHSTKKSLPMQSILILSTVEADPEMRLAPVIQNLMLTSLSEKFRVLKHIAAVLQ